MGDSFTFDSYGVPIDQMWHQVFERQLSRRSGRRVQVLSLSAPAVGPRFELRLWELEGRRLDADLVVLAFFVGNDFTDEAGVPLERGLDAGLARHSLAFRLLRNLVRLRTVEGAPALEADTGANGSRAAAASSCRATRPPTIPTCRPTMHRPSNASNATDSGSTPVRTGSASRPCSPMSAPSWNGWHARLNAAAPTSSSSSSRTGHRPSRPCEGVCSRRYGWERASWSRIVPRDDSKPSSPNAVWRPWTCWRRFGARLRSLPCTSAGTPTGAPPATAWPELRSRTSSSLMGSARSLKWPDPTEINPPPAATGRAG